jgi:toxin ParE1/3/4
VTLPVVWIPEANEDLLEARAWYDNIRPQLGEHFALAVEATIEAIAEHPSQFPVVHRSRRRAGVRRFPYGILFEIQEREVQEHRIVVIACFHGRRNPRRWQSR